MEKYISPEMDINEFAAEDVVTASGGGCSPVDTVVTPGLCDTLTDGLCLDGVCSDTCGMWEAW